MWEPLLTHVGGCCPQLWSPWLQFSQLCRAEYRGTGAVLLLSHWGEMYKPCSPYTIDTGHHSSATFMACHLPAFWTANIYYFGSNYVIFFHYTCWNRLQNQWPGFIRKLDLIIFFPVILDKSLYDIHTILLKWNTALVPLQFELSSREATAGSVIYETLLATVFFVKLSWRTN